MSHLQGLPHRWPSGCRVLLRADLNVPIKAGRVIGMERIRASAHTIQRLADKGCRVLIMSHLGRPEAGHHDPAASLEPVAQTLSEQLKRKVRFVRDWLDGISLRDGEICLLENVRFLKGEVDNSDALGRKMAALCDVFVMDAFGSAHRAHASTHAVARHAPRACAGPLLVRELRMLEKALENPKTPVLAIIGGAKVSSKLGVLVNLAEISDAMIVGGGIANTFMAAAGLPVGDSLYEPTQLELARELDHPPAGHHARVQVPRDVVCLCPDSSQPVVRNAPDVRSGERIMDVGPRTCQAYAKLVQKARTVIWNGPLGVFEDKRFAAGTFALGRAIAANADAFTIGGGGDTLAAVSQLRIKSRMSYLSTGGGAFLEYAAGHTLPAVEVLREVA